VVSLLIPVVGPCSGLLPLTSGEGDSSWITDPVLGQEGYCHLTSGLAAVDWEQVRH